MLWFVARPEGSERTPPTIVIEGVEELVEALLAAYPGRERRRSMVDRITLPEGTTSAATPEDRDSGVRAAQSLGGAWIVGRKNGQARIALLELPDHCRRPMKLCLVANARNPARLEQL
jgi:hypothetical protein